MAAGAPFYGRQPGADDVPKIMAPIQAHYADPKLDTGVGNGIEPFAAAMKANNKSLVVFTYDGAQHGFHNDTTPRYDEKSAKLATTRYMEFFNKNLR
jgi:carboxymethylenebutenolidase